MSKVYRYRKLSDVSTDFFFFILREIKNFVSLIPCVVCNYEVFFANGIKSLGLKEGEVQPS